MAQGQISKTESEKNRKVYCSNCRHFKRDTEGISRRVDTGEFFLGVSDIGCDPDHTFNILTNRAKIFADKPRTCKEYSDGQ